jgi:C4-dicarboxylate-specific signal transduction histidine kinase
MQFANEIFFLVVALILWGLFFGSKSLFRLRKINQPEGFWLAALAFNASSFTFFAAASSTHLVLVTLGNTFLIANVVYLALFCRSLSDRVNQRLKILSAVGILAFGLLFEYLRHAGTFTERVTLVSVIASACLVWELIELKRLRKTQTNQLTFLFFTIAAELSLTFARLAILYFSSTPSSINLYQEAPLSTAVRWSWVGVSVLSYIAVISYWMEKLSIENTQSIRENLKITELLKEKEQLIYGLTKANKTSATGALSASIAHELNQPLGASNLNIQLLKMKLEQGALNRDLVSEILESLEDDNRRAATIVKSLRSIFHENNSQLENIHVDDLISKVLDIVKPELKFKNINVEEKINAQLTVKVNSAEMIQVLLNLMNNAIQALDQVDKPTKVIALEVVHDIDFIEISVTDNGSGVTPEYQSQLFGLLNTTKKTGMGLGLWLSKHIVTKHKGSISYEDVPNGGARFAIRLPSTS